MKPIGSHMIESRGEKIDLTLEGHESRKEPATQGKLQQILNERQSSFEQYNNQCTPLVTFQYAVFEPPRMSKERRHSYSDANMEKISVVQVVLFPERRKFCLLKRA